ncbi:MAG: Hsp20/alpha crystallin family protein [Christensenellales bacterium]|jgi:HSP20 family protein
MFGLIPYTAKLTNRQNARDFWNPFSDDFFRAFFDREQSTGSPRVDVVDKGDHYLLEADLPGVKKEDLRVSIDEGVLTIAAELKDQKEQTQENYVYRERRFGRMCRSFNLDGIREADIAAEYNDGVLKLNLPKATETAAGAREIAIE